MFTKYFCGCQLANTVEKHPGFSLVPDARCVPVCARLCAAVYQLPSPQCEPPHLPLCVQDLPSRLCLLWHPPAFPLERTAGNIAAPQTAPLPERSHGEDYHPHTSQLHPVPLSLSASPPPRRGSQNPQVLQLDLLCVPLLLPLEKYKRNHRFLQNFSKQLKKCFSPSPPAADLQALEKKKSVGEPSPKAFIIR